MKRQLLFCDKDDTLIDAHFDFFPGVPEFLRRQHRNGRELIIATRAGRTGKEHFIDLSNILQDYFGHEDLNKKNGFYRDQNQQLKAVCDDYRLEVPPMSLCMLLQILGGHAIAVLRYLKNSIQMRCSDSGDPEMTLTSECLKVWRQSIERVLTHRKDGSLFKEQWRYQNPHTEGRWYPKDLQLARELYLGKPHEDERAVMIGDDKDVVFSTAAPDIPFIIVLEKKWATRSAVDLLLRSLYREEESAADMFDHHFARGKAVVATQNGWNSIPRTVITEIQNKRFVMCRRRKGGRIIFEWQPVLFKGDHRRIV